LTAHIQHRKIKRLGIADYVEVMVTSEEAGQEKPSPVAFEMILKKLSEKADIKPEQVLMIGDSQTKDVDGAVMGGMKGMLYRKSDANNMNGTCLRYIDDDE
jgi:putative hydrolase of the HAD superfamily